MEMRLPFVGLALCCLLGAARRTSADDAPKPDLKPLLKEVRKVVEKHYPKATVTLKDQTIHFEFNTRKFMIHEPTLTGEWQDAREEMGPQKGGCWPAASPSAHAPTKADRATNPRRIRAARPDR